MSARSARLVRVARGGAAATAATFLALMSHVAAGAVPPHAVGMLVPWLSAVLVCTALAGRTFSLSRLALAVAISQTVFHTLFVLGAFAAFDPTSSHSHDAAAHSVADATATLTAQADPLMAFSHIVAGVLTVALLARGERAVRQALRIVQAFVAWLARLAPVLAPPAPVRRSVPTVVVRRLRAGAERCVICRRGPPMGLVI